MRRLVSPVIAVLVVTGFGMTLAPNAGAKATPTPVTLVGTVTRKGTQTAVGNRIAVVAREHSFTPTFIRAKPGTTLTITITNKGTQDHTFTVPGRNVDVTLTKGTRKVVTVEV